METICQDTKTELTLQLNEFLKNWDKNYQSKIEKIPVFNSANTTQLSLSKKQLFVTMLYHQRGHFGEVLWYLGNVAPNPQAKKMILDNIQDEFGNHGPSHEKLYLMFAKSLGIDLSNEALEEKFYLPFLREYNQGHLWWLRKHSWDHNLAAFAALERLDNVDYIFLKSVAESFQVKSTDLVFFNAHIHVKHYENMVDENFMKLWKEKSGLVKECFDFIGNYQLEIWKKISDELFNDGL